MSGVPKRAPHEEPPHSSSLSSSPSMRPTTTTTTTHGSSNTTTSSSGTGNVSSSNNNNNEEAPAPRVNHGPGQGLLPRPDSERRPSSSPMFGVFRDRERTHFPSMSPPSSGVGADYQPYTAGGGSQPRPDRAEAKGVESGKEGQHSSGKGVEESKEGRNERERGQESQAKGEVSKVRKEGVEGVPKRGKEYILPNWQKPGIGNVSSQLSRGKHEVVKEGNSVVKVEGNESGESRGEAKGEDKFNKDRKRKEGKHYDWPESDKEKEKDRSDFSRLLHVAGGNAESKEVAKEEKDSDRLERERKDVVKEKEVVKEREKENVEKKDGRNGVEEGSSHDGKDAVEKGTVPENVVVSVEPKKPTESWRNAEREAKERRKERDNDVENERPEKRRCVDKEAADDGGADMDIDKERDAFSYGIQQKKRMLRPRGSPQVNRDVRLKPRGQDSEGSQGKPEVSTVYKVGECLQELTKLWKEYESSQADKSSDSLSNGPTLEVRIAAEHVTATNRQVRGGQLWGTDIYTDDSDLVAVLMHTGYCRPTASLPPAAIQELRATIRVLPPQESYVSTLRNNVRSRAWGAAIGCSYRVERCCIMKKGGGTIDLEPCLTHTSTIEPTLAPVAVERTMTTRAAASNALRQQRYVREVTIQYNLCNEPWIKYSISIVADKGLKKPMYTSARLKKGEVLYLETHSCRYELCFDHEKSTKISEAETEKLQNQVPSVNGERIIPENIDMFRWSRCKKPLPQKVMRSLGIPLPLDHLEVLEENLDWEDVLWSQTGVWVAGKEYPLARVHFLSR